MPYTPPTRSPSASPRTSRSTSFSTSTTNNSNVPRTSTISMMGGSNPPRSATYLHKHRRNSSTSSPTLPLVYPMASMNAIANSPVPTTGMVPTAAAKDPRAGESLHQSPPPTDNVLAKIPTGAVMSPPDSSQNSSDEEENGARRGRDLGNLEAELKEAIRHIPQRREPSPDSLSREGQVTMDDSSLQPPRRRIQHQRSTSDASFLVDIARSGSGGSSRSGSEYDVDDDDYRLSQPMIRKKSGELVKSSLKSPSRSRPISMPSTPTFSKNVHFDSQMEHVRHFLHSEKPSAVSAGSSPVEMVFDGDNEYPFYDPADQFDWEIILPNFPKDLDKRKALPVRLEKVCLSSDQKSLIGTVAVANLAFQKHVTTRFTFDYWQTVSEVTAEYSTDVRRKELEDGVDRFVFKIKLAEQANLEKKTLFFSICYRTAGQELWDNNSGFNFQVDFKTKPKQAAASRPKKVALPRSKQVTTSNNRPRSMPNMDEFDFLSDAYFKQAQQTRDSNDPRSPRSKKSETEPATTLPARRANPSGNAFGNRYDFGASLNAAIKAATVFMGPQQKGRMEKEVTPTENPNAPAYFDVPIAASPVPVASPPTKAKDVARGPVGELKATQGFFNNEKPSIESPSYRELLDNYCFFGTAKASTSKGPSNPPPAEKKKEHGRSVQLAISSPNEKASSPQYTLTTFNGSASPPAMTLSQHAASGNTSPIPMNYAGYRHTRRQSGAFRFDATKTPTAIC